jgi:hypothetical protein
VNHINVSFIDPKFGPKHLDSFAYNLSTKIKNLTSSEKLIFNLSNLEWVSHEELVYLSGVLKQLFIKKVNFYINFRSEEQLIIRQAKQIISLWDYWRIQSFVPSNSIGGFDYDKYMDIDVVYIRHLKNFIIESEGKSKFPTSRYFITPFTSFNFGNGDNQEQKIAEDIKRLYKLDEKTNRKLIQYQSQTPFLNKTLSHIITKELYENSYDHAFDGVETNIRECYFGLTLRNKLQDNQENLQTILHQNFIEEEIPQAINFFKANGKFKNESLLQFTFLDFGIGIPKSLEKAYNLLTNEQKESIFSESHFVQSEDTQILEYAFKASSSRQAISMKFANREQIPRGLYDVIEIVRRYRGLIVARSYGGKVLFDLSSGSTQDAVRYFGDSKEIFQGTLISIYIPENKQGIKKSSIKDRKITSGRSATPAYISILELQKSIYKVLKEIPGQDDRKIALYEKTFEAIDNFLDTLPAEKSTVYLDFAACELDERPLRKILYYLASTYRINENTNAVIVNPPDRNLLITVRDTIISLHPDVNEFLFHPLPCIYFDDDKQFKEVVWIGVPNPHDERLLTETLNYEFDSKRRSDFELPDALEGNVISFDQKGNMIRNSPSISEMALTSTVLNCTLKGESEVFLTAGNYYQYEFISFLEFLQEEKNCNFFIRHLLSMIPMDVIEKVEIVLSITLSSQLLAKALTVAINERTDRQSRPALLVRVSNYHSFFKEKPFADIKEGSNILLVADVIGTGSLWPQLKNIYIEKDAS